MSLIYLDRMSADLVSLDLVNLYTSSISRLNLLGPLDILPNNRRMVVSTCKLEEQHHCRTSGYRTSDMGSMANQRKE
jgi:hypothetical protein